MIALEERPAEPAASTEGDREAQFRAELIELLPFLRAFSSKVSRDGQLAEDLTQEVLTKAWKARTSYQCGTNLKAWLCTILKNEYGTYQRRAWRQVPWDAIAAAEIRAPQGGQLWASELTDIRRALACLGIEQREALLLIAVAGYSYGEAASLCKTPVGTMKSRLSRARTSLERILQQGEGLPNREPFSDGNALSKFLAEAPHASAPDAVRSVSV
jgi:RNA polymerase sigma-70 factor (ECF subfamily)